MQRKSAEVHEQKDLGPGCFSLERLWAIFRCIVVDAGALALGFGQLYSLRHLNVVSEEVDGDGEETEVFSADVLMQLSTLAVLNLLSKGCMNSLDGNIRYRCNVDINSMQKVSSPPLSVSHACSRSFLVDQSWDEVHQASVIPVSEKLHAMLNNSRRV